MKVPGSPRLHVWVGLVLALAGVLVGGYAYTSWRIYYLHYLPIALVGLVLLVGGSALAGYGQANRPRLGGRGAADEAGLLDRLTASIAGLTGSAEDERSAEDDSDDEDQATPEEASGEEASSADGEPAGPQSSEEAGGSPGGA